MGDSDMWSNTLQLDHGGAPLVMRDITHLGVGSTEQKTVIMLQDDLQIMQPLFDPVHGQHVQFMYTSLLIKQNMEKSGGSGGRFIHSASNRWNYWL